MPGRVALRFVFYLRKMSMRPLFLKHIAQTSPAPLLLEIEHASGCYLHGQAGKRYLDLISGIAVSSLGHGQPKVIEAIAAQAKKHLHVMVYGELIQSPQVKLAEKLASLLPPTLSSVYFVNSGSEAIEGALKLAKRATGRSKIIAFEKAYHGSTLGALSLGSEEWMKNAFRPLPPGIEYLAFNDVSALLSIDHATACVVVEPIQGEAGVRVPDSHFLASLRKRCDEVGALLIFDEIQTGMGRTGKIFCFEHYKITPDILCLGKALGAGMPLGAFVADQHLMRVLTNRPVLGHITTFGGHPVSCAAALAGIEVLHEQDLVSQVPAKETMFRKHLDSASTKAFRSKGLMMALDFGDAALVQRILLSALDKGLLADWFLYADDCIRIAPPLIISEQEIHEACGILLESISQSSRS